MCYMHFYLNFNLNNCSFLHFFTILHKIKYDFVEALEANLIEFIIKNNAFSEGNKKQISTNCIQFQCKCNNMYQEEKK